MEKKTVSNVSLHFVPSLQSAVCILYWPIDLFNWIHFQEASFMEMRPKIIDPAKQHVKNVFS